MKLLNLGCGAVRPQGEEWINADNLHATLEPGTPERGNLDAERNYYNLDMEQLVFPWTEDVFDGIVMSHVIEHFDCRRATEIMEQCRTMLKPGGVLLVSVPDATVFRRNWDEDTVENAERLYGEPIYLPDGHTDFLSYAGFNQFHKVLLSEDSLWCYFVRAGFERIWRIKTPIEFPAEDCAASKLCRILNRLPFSLIMATTK
jgi:predicted SAM-dependent methyltransferase